MVLTLYICHNLDFNSTLTFLDDVGKRYFGFFVIGCIALAFGGILAYGLMHIDGLSAMTGWRWIFIMEGVVWIVFYPDHPLG